MRIKRITKNTVYPLIFLVVAAFCVGSAWAHCDRINGPVADDAREALETKKFEVAAKWVGKEQEKKLRTVYEETLPVFQMGGKARNLAEQYFIETTIRLHRAAEGFPYTGVKPASPLPEDIAAAEKALDTGNLEPVSNLLASEMRTKLQDLFKQVREAKKHKQQSLSAGREWVDAYVRYVIYVHGLYQTIQAGPEHGVGE